MCVKKMIERVVNLMTPNKSKLLMMIYRDVHERDEGNQTLLQPRPTHPLQREQRDQCKLIIILSSALLKKYSHLLIQN